MLRKILFIILSALAISFIIKISTSNFSEIKDSLGQLNIVYISIAIVIYTLMLILKAYLHVLIVNDFDGIKVNGFLIFNAYIQAQIIRYIPGKIWGVIYQGEKLDKVISRKVVWLANLWQMIVTNINGLIVIIFGLGFFAFEVDLLIYLFLFLISLTFFLLRVNYTSNAKYFLCHVNKDLACGIPALGDKIKDNALGKFSLLQLDWLLYFIFWFMILPEEYDLISATLLGVIYAGAAIIGLLVIVVPSGWFVREASFIWIGVQMGYSEDILILYSVLVRLIAIIGDVLSCLLTSFVNIAMKRELYD